MNMITLKRIQRRARRTNTLIDRLIKRLNGDNGILRTGISRAQTQVNANNVDIEQALVLKQETERVLGE
jgi:hypothetical protein